MKPTIEILTKLQENSSKHHQGNSIYFPEITICSTLGLKAAI